MWISSTVVSALLLLCSQLNTVLSQCSGSPLTISVTEEPAMFESPGFSSTGYSANQYCEWLLDSGASGQTILLYFDTMTLGCSHNDTVTIYDGSTTSATTLVSGLCATTSSIEYTSSGRYVLVSFTSDSGSTDVGFQLTYLSAPDTSSTGCSSEVTLSASTTAQYLTSSGFPGKYSSLSSCRWKIVASNTLSTVYIEVVFIDVEDDPSCGYDKLTIYDGGYLCENKVAHELCGGRTKVGDVITNFTSTGDSVLVYFTSDSSFEKKGFVIKYTENFVNFSTTSTTPSAISSAMASSTSGSGVTYKSIITETKNELNIPVMVACYLAGSATVVGVIAIIRLVKYMKVRKKAKKGISTVQTIAPLPARPTVFTPRHGTNVLSFV